VPGRFIFRNMLLQDYIGNTPLVTLQRLGAGLGNRISVKMEGNNPAGSVKDRPAYSMIRHAELRGDIAPGDTLVEATSGNTGIALAMVAAMRGYRLILIMPDNMSHERVTTMRAYGAEIILVSEQEGMMKARDIAVEMNASGTAKMLDQFANPDNPRAHYETTAPEIWQQSEGEITHFVSSMGTTGTIMGCSRYFREVSSEIQIVGVQPTDGSAIPGIRRWPEAYIPKIYQPEAVDRIIQVSRVQAEKFTLALAAEEGIFCGISSGGAVCASLLLAAELTDAHIVTIICDRGDRYLTTGVFQ
jgi:cysteine synthase B